MPLFAAPLAYLIWNIVLYENAEIFCQFDFIINEMSEIEVAEADIKLVPASISSSSSGLVM